MIQETKKILEDENLKMGYLCTCSSCIRAFRIGLYRTGKEATVTEIKEVLMDAPGVILQDNLVNSCIQCHYMQKGK